MKKQILTAIFCLALYCADAQVVLTNVNTPTNGTAYILSNKAGGTPFSFSKTGTGNTWDFTGVTTSPTDDDTVVFADPAATGGASTFPSATHARQRKPGEDAMTYLKINASGVYVLGGKGDIAGTGGDIAVTYNPELTLMTFPYTTNSTVNTEGLIDFYTTGAALGQTIIDSANLKIRTISTQEVVATGSLVLPAGTYPAMLERTVTITYDSTRIKGSITGGNWTFAPYKPDTTIDSIFNWYTQASMQPYATIIYKEGKSEEILYFKSLELDHTAIREAAEMTAVRLYPNPAKHEVSLTLESPALVELFNTTGQRVLARSLPAGTSTLQLDEMPSGVYLARVQDANGVKSVKLVHE